MIEISGFAQAHCILGSALAGEGLRSASMAAGSHGRNCDEGTNSSRSLYSIGKCSKTWALFSCKVQNSKTITSNENLICMEY